MPRVHADRPPSSGKRRLKNARMRLISHVCDVPSSKARETHCVDSTGSRRFIVLAKVKGVRNEAEGRRRRHRRRTLMADATAASLASVFEEQEEAWK